MILSRLKSLLLVLLVSLTVAACGGGGDGGSEAITVKFTPANVDAYGNTGGASAFFGVTAALSKLPSGNVFVYIVDPSAVIQTGATVVTQNSDGTFSATLAARPTLGVGVYTGTLTLRLCKDSACVSEHALSGAALPYKVTILPTTAVAGAKNGLAVAPDSVAPDTYLLNVGDTVTLTSNVPVTWTYPDSIYLSSVAVTSTTFSATAAAISIPLDIYARASQLPGCCAPHSHRILAKLCCAPHSHRILAKLSVARFRQD